MEFCGYDTHGRHVEMETNGVVDRYCVSAPGVYFTLTFQHGWDRARALDSINSTGTKVEDPPEVPPEPEA